MIDLTSLATLFPLPLPPVPSPVALYFNFILYFRVGVFSGPKNWGSFIHGVLDSVLFYPLFTSAGYRAKSVRKMSTSFKMYSNFGAS